MTVTKFGYELNYKTEFIDLRPYADLAMRRMWRIQFPNKYGASIIGGGPGAYGDGEKTFEVMILYKGELATIPPSRTTFSATSPRMKFTTS